MGFLPLSQGESAGAFKAFTGFSLSGSGPGGGGVFGGFGNGTGFKPLSTSSAPASTPAGKSHAVPLRLVLMYWELLCCLMCMAVVKQVLHLSKSD